MKKFFSIMLLLCATMMFSSFSYEGDDEGGKDRDRGGDDSSRSYGRGGDGSNNRGEYTCPIDLSSEEVELIIGEGADSYVKEKNRKENCDRMSRDQCLENSMGCCCELRRSGRDFSSDIRSAETYRCENTRNRKDYCNQVVVSVMNWMIACGENSMDGGE